MPTGFAKAWPRSMSLRSIPRNQDTPLSPAWPWSEISVKELQYQLQLTSELAFKPAISTYVVQFNNTCSMRPVATVPTHSEDSSGGIMNGLSCHVLAQVIAVHCVSQFHKCSCSSPSRALRANYDDWATSLSKPFFQEVHMNYSSIKLNQFLRQPCPSCSRRQRSLNTACFTKQNVLPESEALGRQLQR